MSMNPIRIFQVGGSVRDGILGKQSKDLDFAVEAPSFDAMVDFLTAEGFVIFTQNPEFVTVRAHFPRNHPEHGRTTADFVLCRVDGPSSDGRRPDFVTAGSIFDDLARRDFTVNAIAIDPDGNVLDPHNGRQDLADNILRCVGDTQTRFTEDALRPLRAIRFAITKGFDLHPDIVAALHDPATAQRLLEVLPNGKDRIPANRVFDEISKCFRFDTVATLDFLFTLPKGLRDAIFSRGLRLEACAKK